MTSFLSRIFSVLRGKDNKPKDISITVNVMNKKITVRSAVIDSSKESVANLRDRRSLRYRRYNRLMRHKKIWAVLSYAKSLNAVYNSKNFYDFDKALLDYHNAVARFNDSDLRPSELDILCAIRFCDVQNHMGKCEHRLSEAQKQDISNWSTYTLDYKNILKTVSKRFMEYEDELLETYKRMTDYTKRIEYIIRHLNEVKHREGLSTIPQLDEYINDVRIHYLNLKSKSLTNSSATSKETVEP